MKPREEWASLRRHVLIVFDVCSHHQFVKSMKSVALGIRASYPFCQLHRTPLMGPRLALRARPPRQLSRLAAGNGCALRGPVSMMLRIRDMGSRRASHAAVLAGM